MLERVATAIVNAFRMVMGWTHLGVAKYVDAVSLLSRSVVDDDEGTVLLAFGSVSSFLSFEITTKASM